MLKADRIGLVIVVASLLVGKDTIEVIERMEQRQTSDTDDLNGEMGTFFGLQ